MNFKQWEGFTPGDWTSEINVRDFIQANYTPYTGDDSFLTPATEKTTKLWNKVLELYKKEVENGDVLDVDTKTPSTINGCTIKKSNYAKRWHQNCRKIM